MAQVGTAVLYISAPLTSCTSSAVTKYREMVHRLIRVAPVPGTVTSTVISVDKEERFDDIKTKKSAYYIGNILIYNYLRIIGVLPLWSDKKGDFRFRWNAYISLYAYFMVGAYLCGNIITNRELMLINRDNLLFQERLGLFFLLADFIFPPVIIVCLLLEVRRIGFYLDEWRIFQSIYQRTTGNPLVIKRRNAHYAFFAMTSLKSIHALHYGYQLAEAFSLAGNGEKYKTPKIFVLTVFHHSCLLDAMLGLSLFLLKNIRDIGDQLESSFMTCVNPSPQLINDYFRTWRELANLTTAISHVFGKSFMTFTLFGYCLSMSCWYLLALEVGDFSSNLILSIIITYYYTRLPEACHVTTEKIGSLMMRAIVAQRDKSDLTSDQRKELNQFEISHKHFPPKIEFINFFHMTRLSYILIYSEFFQALNSVRLLKEEIPTNGFSNSTTDSNFTIRTEFV